jgi:hypothetical protein
MKYEMKITLVTACRGLSLFRKVTLSENSAVSEGAGREASNELFSRDFSDEKEIHSTPTSIHEHARTVGARFPQRVRSSWFGDLLRWRAGTSCHAESGCNSIAFAISHPVSNFCAAQHSAPVRWIGFNGSGR